MQNIFTSERYLRLIDAIRQGDFAAARAIRNEGIAQSEGAEKAHWLLFRAGSGLGLPVPPVSRIRADVDAAVAIAPDDPEVMMFAVLSAINLVLVTEQPSHLEGWWRRIPRVVRRTQDPWQIYHSLGKLAWLRRRLPVALRHFDRVLAEMAVWPPDRLEAFSGRYFLAHCFRAIIALEMGEVEMAERDVAAAVARYEKVRKVYVSDRALAIAQAGLALTQRDLQGARRPLQLIRAREKEERYSRDSFPLKAEMEFMAGRIALAEGNLQAFEHFTGRALEVAGRHNLPMTVQRLAAMRRQALSEAGLSELATS